MSVEKMRRLVSRLSEKTFAGHIMWEETETADVYQAAFPDYVVRIWKRTNEGGGKDYVIGIYNSRGTLLDEASDVAMDPDDDYHVYDLMESVYESARGYALGVEQALDSLLSTLEDKGKDVPF